jgi:hypothetical protein
MIRLPKALLIATSSLALTGVAVAQDDPPPEGEGEAAPAPATPEPDAAAAPMSGPPPLVLGKSKILIAGSTFNLNLSSDAVGKPISLAPSVHYGVNEKLTVGLTHDTGSTPWTPRIPIFFTSITVGPVTAVVAGGRGICLTGEENGCGKAYNSPGIDALYSIKSEKFSLAAHGGLDFITFDPFAMSLRIGALGRYMVNDKIAVVFDPRIAIGLTEREVNGDGLDIPVWAWYMVNEKLGAYLHLGIAGPFDGFGDGFSIPLGLGANYKVNEKLSVGGDFHFLNLLGKNGGADGRALGLRVIYAL